MSHCVYQILYLTCLSVCLPSIFIHIANLNACPYVVNRYLFCKENQQGKKGRPGHSLKS